MPQTKANLNEILKSLTKTKKNKTEAAKNLNMLRGSLQSKIKRSGLKLLTKAEVSQMLDDSLFFGVQM